MFFDGVKTFTPYYYTGCSPRLARHSQRLRRRPNETHNYPVRGHGRMAWQGEALFSVLGVSAAFRSGGRWTLGAGSRE